MNFLLHLSIHNLGQYFDGVEEGEGTITYADGNVLEGEFSDGKIHGNAVFKYPNGDQREGFFFDNVLDGQVIYTKNNGMIIIEVWKNGEPIPDKETIVRHGETDPTTTSSDISTTTTTPKFDLSELRNTIRSSDRTQVFKSFDNKDDKLPPREPKNQDQNSMDIQMLRKITDQSNRDFLFSVFNRVNAG